MAIRGSSGANSNSGTTGTQTTVTPNYFSVSVIDATGEMILPPVRSVNYGPRGQRTTSSMSYDKNGNLVESDWKKKIDLYLIINDASKLKSERVKAIDNRITDATKSGLSYLSSLQAVYTPDNFDAIYALVPTILSVAGLAVGGEVGGKVGASIGNLVKSELDPPNDNYKKELYKKRAYALDYEVKKLTVLRADLTGEYLQYDALGDKLGLRSANNDNTLLWVSLVLLFFLAAFYYYKKKRKQL